MLRNLQKIGSAYHQARRLGDIAGVLMKYGYVELARHLPLPRAERLPFRRLRNQQTDISGMSKPERLRRACEELGPTFVKLGQLAAARTRMLPLEYTDELSKLQDQVAPMAPEQFKASLREELGRPINEVFDELEALPLGAASIAQVHKARLKSGDWVVVKVQRPGITQTVSEDLALLLHLAKLAEDHLPELRHHHPVALVEELSRSLTRELDFLQEAAHMDRFAWQFRDESRVHIPKVYHPWCTRRLLVMEHMGGIKPSDPAALRVAGIDPIALSSHIADLVMKQIFTHGFFHADPHPGNLRVLPDGTLCFLDFGMMGYLNRRTRENFVDLVWGISGRNEGTVAKALLKLAESDDEPQHGSFETDVAEFMHQHFYQKAGELRFADLVKNLLELMHRHQMRLPPDLVLMIKALSVTEELVGRLDPQHDLVAQARPFMQHTRMERVKPARLLRGLLDFSEDLGETLRELPGEMRRILSQLKGGRTRVTFHHEGLEPAANAIERSANRLSFALVVAALIIGSSLTIHSKVPPLWGNVSVLGAGGYLMAGLLGLWLLISILRHGRM